MEEKVGVASCDRGTGLVALLYGETTEAESDDLRQHMETCSACKAEFANFTQIRRSIFEWRQDSLAAVSLTTTQLTAPQLKKPSAMAAIRQFLDWSPLWMKGAVAFATLLFCLLAFLALAGLRTTTQEPVVTGYQNNDTPKKVDQTGPRKTLEPREPEASVSSPAAKNQTFRPVRKPSLEFDLKQVAKTRRPLSKTERQQLAADLRLISPSDEADLDLLGDRLTPQE